jgi:hypothetical protein
MARKPPLTVVGSTSTLSSSDASPRPLGEHGAQLWRSITSSYDISDEGGRAVLAEACTMADRAAELAAAIARDGVVLSTRTGLRSHPAIRDEIQARSFITRSLQRLGLSFEAVKPIGRPPGSAW